jgi:hypothetical protein
MYKALVRTGHLCAQANLGDIFTGLSKWMANCIQAKKPPWGCVVTSPAPTRSRPIWHTSFRSWCQRYGLTLTLTMWPSCALKCCDGYLRECHLVRCVPAHFTRWLHCDLWWDANCTPSCDHGHLDMPLDTSPPQYLLAWLKTKLPTALAMLDHSTDQDATNNLVAIEFCRTSLVCNGDVLAIALHGDIFRFVNGFPAAFA